MKIIHRSILKELAVTFLLSIAFLNFILMMEKLLRLSRFLSGLGASLADMLKVIIYLQPQLLLLTIPMALLLSTLLVYGRLNLDNELIILKASGMNFRNIILPVAFLGAVCFLMNIATSFYIGPKSMVSLRDELTNIIKVRTPLAIEEGRFNTAFKDLVIMVREKPADETLKGVFIYDGRNETQPKVLTALEGKIFLSGGYQVHMDLREGCIHIVKGNTTTEIYFDRYQLALDLESMPPSRKISEFTPQEIVREISNPGLSKEDASRLVSLQIELHRRLSLPFLCIILIFLGPPLSLIAGKSGRLGGLVLGLLVFAVYYVLLIYAENLVKAGQLFHITGTWAPTVLLTIVAILMFKKETNR